MDGHDEFAESGVNSEILDDDESGQLMEILLNTREQCQMIDNLIKNQIEVKDKMIDKLHGELEYYKQDSAERFVEQLMKAVIKIRKDMSRRIKSDSWDSIAVNDIKREYLYIYQDITDLLEQQNVDAYHTEPGQLFDPAIHQAKTEQTDDPQLNKMVKRSLEEGYKKKDRVLQPEKVVVYQYKA
jgi:molecular chaperone GrpE (heat shock protein)